MDTSIGSIISNNFYVDNLIQTSNDPQELLSDFHKISNELVKAGFRLRDCTCNASVLSNLDSNLVSKSETVKVLGYVYNSRYDTLSIKVEQLDSTSSTKRKILSSISKIFDPIGFITPVLVNFKIFMQTLHRENLSWDKPLPGNLKFQWQKLTKEFNSEISNFSVKRQALDSFDPYDIVIFADSSKEAYGCVFYAVQNEAVNFLFSKVKVAPLQSRTLPTLELLSAYVAIKCLDCYLSNSKIKSNLIKNVTILVDNQCALTWLLTGKANRKNTFVNNRLKEIKVISDNISNLNINLKYSYVPSEHNMADWLTRNNSTSSFIANKDKWLYVLTGWLTVTVIGHLVTLVAYQLNLLTSCV